MRKKRPTTILSYENRKVYLFYDHEIRKRRDELKTLNSFAVAMSYTTISGVMDMLLAIADIWDAPLGDIEIHPGVPTKDDNICWFFTRDSGV